MRLVKSEFVQFFTAGFVGGALLVAATIGIGPAGAVASSHATTSQVAPQSVTQ